MTWRILSERLILAQCSYTTLKIFMTSALVKLFPFLLTGVKHERMGNYIGSTYIVPT